MNALYVTVSIPLLLVLAGFNHAHGLTTFGKTGGGNQNPQPTAMPKRCHNQTNCSLIKGTTCLRGNCLCGDNSHPNNGACNTLTKGPQHLCTTNDECVDGADCLTPKEKSKPNGGTQPSSNDIKVCTCTEGFTEQEKTCAGASSMSFLPGLIAMIAVLVKTLN